jgi:hypothetical protein
VRDRARHDRKSNKKYIFMVWEVQRQCPFVLLVKLGWREGKVLGSEESKVMVSGIYRAMLVSEGFKMH